jgi:hypothetical protein
MLVFPAANATRRVMSSALGYQPDKTLVAMALRTARRPAGRRQLGGQFVDAAPQRRQLVLVCCHSSHPTPSAGFPPHLWPNPLCTWASPSPYR